MEKYVEQLEEDLVLKKLKKDKNKSKSSLGKLASYELPLESTKKKKFKGSLNKVGEAEVAVKKITKKKKFRKYKS